jgi:hypothetical protein
VVEPGPDVKYVITTSSSEMVNASIAPAKMPGAASGNTTRRNAWNGVAPRSAAASTSRLSNADRRAFTTTTTNAMQNVMWARITVLMLRSTCAASVERGERHAHDDLGSTSETKIKVSNRTGRGT